MPGQGRVPAPGFPGPAPPASGSRLLPGREPVRPGRGSGHGLSPRPGRPEPGRGREPLPLAQGRPGKTRTGKEVVNVRKERITITIDPDVLREARARFPGSATSAVVENCLRLALERGDLVEQVQTLEVLVRGLLIMGSEYIAGKSGGDAEQLQRSVVQKGIAQVKRRKERRKEKDADSGAAAQEGAES